MAGEHAVGIAARPDYFFNPRTNPTFAPVFGEAGQCGVLLATTGTTGADYLAQYDPVTNVIHVPPTAPAQLRPSDRLELRRSTAHELFHAVLAGRLLGPELTAGQRAAVLDRRTVAMTEDQYAQVSWQEELNAERFAWRCFADELKLPPSDRDRLVELRSQQFAGANQAAYDAEFRATHQGARRRQPQQPAPRTVAFGKCLSLITRDLWDDVFLWPVLYDANRAAIGPDPNVVKPGLALAVPDLNQFSPSQLADAQRRGRAWKPSR